ncbi:hypothetical protein [Streptomyces sp. NBC_00076]|uniref:hypothetical protein n=1 Tax=Streptomyces sp. NBC_00076 TaxID=2975642 RepID=UPI00386BD297
MSPSRPSQLIGEAEDVAARQLKSALRTLTEGDLGALGSALGALEALTRRLRDRDAEVETAARAVAPSDRSRLPACSPPLPLPLPLSHAVTAPTPG